MPLLIKWLVLTDIPKIGGKPYDLDLKIAGRSMMPGEFPKVLCTAGLFPITFESLMSLNPGI